MKIEDVGRVHRYVCNQIDLSFTRETLRRWVVNPIFRRLPPALDPDRITLTGFSGVLFSAGLMLLLPAAQRRDPLVGPLVMVTVIVLLFIYAVADQLDGMQAGRQQRRDPRGDFLDHWVDALGAGIMPAAFCWWFAFPPAAALALVVGTTTVFWLSSWDAQHRGQRLLPRMGGLEGIETGIGILFVGAIWGPDAFHTRLLGAPAYAVPLLIGMVSLGWGALRYLWRADSGYLELVGLLASLAPLLGWYALAPHEPTVYLLIGLFGVKHIADQQQRQLLGAALSPFAPGLIGAGLALLVCAARWPWYLDAAAVVVLGLTALALVWQALGIWRYVDEALATEPAPE